MSVCVCIWLISLQRDKGFHLNELGLNSFCMDNIESIKIRAHCLLITWYLSISLSLSAIASAHKKLSGYVTYLYTLCKPPAIYSGSGQQIFQDIFAPCFEMQIKMCAACFDIYEVLLDER